MKLSDYVASLLVEEGVSCVFLISGGAVVHLVDSVARNPSIRYICTQHEQAVAMAADAYSRVTGRVGVGFTTSGPGATNLVTGVCCAYFDSVPTLFITGQVARFRLKKNHRLRQKGFQETDVVSIFQSITKYANQVEDPTQIKYELQKALHIARSGRPGPVLLDIPDDVQREEVDPDSLPSFVPDHSHPPQNREPADWVNQLHSYIGNAQRPALIYGAGIRLTGAESAALEFANEAKIPVLLTWGGMDLLPYDHPLNAGGLGVCGPRYGNFAAQNSDLIISVGTRLSQMITGGKQELFGTKARKVMVDNDPEEFAKFGPNSVTIDLPINTEISSFFDACLKSGKFKAENSHEEWWKTIKNWKDRYPVCLEEYRQRTDSVDAYVFLSELSQAAQEGDIIITDAGGNLSWTMQAFRVKKGQRLFSAWNHSPMGYSLPASIGAALGSNKQVLCIIGDGGIMMCLTELATILRHQLPVKVFVFNNHGHGIQKQTLDTWLEGRHEGVDESTGLMFPDFIRIGAAFGMKTTTIRNHTEIDKGIQETLSFPGPVLCNVEIWPDQKIVPMLKFGSSLEDLDPKIDRNELEQIMAVSRIEQ